ncbi:N-acetyl-D-glucosamine kinase isoform X1 [Brachionus plicatilis]|uniref:N-acetyl-D-glucosamine kinase isoform X1 n=1 Tax=Brachionus plicatilis TaxID=10195 RepID=A0A3M7QIW8_BRAPC|nr:N-acetyl-D-glucosamine kinase isoform X1 [Brachionus plicatilis]
MENDLNSIEHEAEEVKQLIFQHFKIDKFDDLLPYFYSDFKKDFIASLAAKLSIMAKQNDVVREIFEETGYQIARHIMALVPKIDKRLFSMQDGLPIVCAGSVFKSWSLIKPGFVQCLNKQIKKFPSLNELNLVLADSDSSIGACLLASKLYDNKIDLISTYKRKSVVLDHFYVNKFQNFYQCETEIFSTDNLIPKEV